MKRLILVLVFMMITALSFADVTYTIKRVTPDGDIILYTITVPDGTDIYAEVAPVVEPLIIPLNPQ